MKRGNLCFSLFSFLPFIFLSSVILTELSLFVALYFFNGNVVKIQPFFRIRTLQKQVNRLFYEYLQEQDEIFRSFRFNLFIEFLKFKIFFTFPIEVTAFVNTENISMIENIYRSSLFIYILTIIMNRKYWLRANKSNVLLSSFPSGCMYVLYTVRVCQSSCKFPRPTEVMLIDRIFNFASEKGNLLKFETFFYQFITF